jgi:hypothetical protein
MALADDIKRAENSHIWERETNEHYVEPEWCSRRLFDEEAFTGVYILCKLRATTGI